MKTLNTLLQNAIEDYLMQLDTITLEDIEEICLTNLSDLVWKTLQDIKTVNTQDRAHSFLKQCASSLLDHPVNTRLGTLKILFRDADRYGLRFWYATHEHQIQHFTLEHTIDDKSPIMAYGFEKIKK